MPRLSPRALLFLFVFAAGSGAWLRFANLGDRPFWQDEAWVATALQQSDLAGLLTQTDLPLAPLFAAILAAASLLPYPPEFAYRLVPAFAGVTLLPLVFGATRALRMPRAPAIAGTVLCAVCLALVIWSRELKPYQLEAALTTLTAWAVFRLRYSDPTLSNRWPTIALVFACTAGPWLSYGVIFGLAPLVGVLLLPTGRKRPLHTASRGFIAGGLLAGSFMVVMALVGADQAANPAFREFWHFRHIDATNLLAWLKAVGWLCQSTFLLFVPGQWLPDADRQAMGGVVLWLVALCAVWTWPGRGRLGIGLWLFGPLVLMLVAALLERYPFGPVRFILLIAPPLTLSLVVATARVLRTISITLVGHGRPGLILVMLLSFMPLLYVSNVPRQHAYWMYHDYPRMLEALRAERRPGELVVIALDAVPGVRYYANDDELDEFVFVPTAAGTLPVPDYDYDAFIWDVMRRSGTRWWLVSLDYRRNEHTARSLQKRATERGAKVTAVDIPQPEYGIGSVVLHRIER